MVDIQACGLCKLRFSDAESPEKVHEDCLEALKYALEKAGAALYYAENGRGGPEFDAAYEEYRQARGRLREEVPG